LFGGELHSGGEPVEVSRRGWRLPHSRLLIARIDSPARSANPSWVSAAASHSLARNAPDESSQAAMHPPASE
jgi:hypothetical protein